MWLLYRVNGLEIRFCLLVCYLMCPHLRGMITDTKSARSGDRRTLKDNKKGRTFMSAPIPNIVFPYIKITPLESSEDASMVATPTTSMPSINSSRLIPIRSIDIWQA